MYQKLAALVARINEAPSQELWDEYYQLRAELDRAIATGDAPCTHS